MKRLSGLLHEADAQLFRKVVNNKEHCIHQLLPPEKILPMKLRASNCIFALPRCQFNLYKRSFVLRSLFEDAYYDCMQKILLYFYTILTTMLLCYFFCFFSMAFDRCSLNDYVLTYLLKTIASIIM